MSYCVQIDVQKSKGVNVGTELSILAWTLILDV